MIIYSPRGPIFSTPSSTKVVVSPNGIKKFCRHLKIDSLKKCIIYRHQDENEVTTMTKIPQTMRDKDLSDNNEPEQRQADVEGHLQVAVLLYIPDVRRYAGITRRHSPISITNLSLDIIIDFLKSQNDERTLLISVFLHLSILLDMISM